jgi:hypothetical protein
MTGRTAGLAAIGLVTASFGFLNSALTTEKGAEVFFVFN